MLNRTQYYFGGFILVVVTILISAGCSQATKSVSRKIVYPPSAETSADLKQFFADQSLGEQVSIQTQDRLVFVQTFPYSGVRASDLFVYQKSAAMLTFFCYFDAPTQQDVDLTAQMNGAIEIRAEGKLVATLPQPAGS